MYGFFAGCSNNYEQVLALLAIRYMQRVSGCFQMEYQNKKYKNIKISFRWAFIASSRNMIGQGDGIGSERMIVALTFRFAMDVWLWAFLWCYEHWPDFICSVNNRIVGWKWNFLFAVWFYVLWYSLSCKWLDCHIHWWWDLCSFSRKEINHFIGTCDECELFNKELWMKIVAFICIQLSKYLLNSIKNTYGK